jgi:oligopeptidase B
MRPDLFRAMILSVPFLDPMTTMLDPKIPLTKVEYFEWGNPADSEQMYDYMASYAPYDTIPESEPLDNTTTALSPTTTTFPAPPLTARRPALLITCGERDQRVDYTQSAKFVARLRSRLNTWYGPEGKEACVLMVDENRGHFGNGTQDDRVKTWAREVVFLLSKVQMEGGGFGPGPVGSGSGSITMGTHGSNKMFKEAS